MTDRVVTRTAAQELGPVTSALLGRLREEARKAGPVIWLDRDGTYTPLVDRLIEDPGAFPFPVLAYRGSYLELMLALEGLEAGPTPEPLVVHLPGFVEDDVKRSPLLELYAPGRRFRTALSTLAKEAAHGNVQPTAIQEAVERGFDSLEDADAWLAGEIRGERAGDRDLELPPTVTQLYDGLARDGVVAKRLSEPGWLDAVDRYLGRTLGVPADWWSERTTGESVVAEGLRLRMATYALCVEYAHDLRREPRDDLLAPLRKLDKPLVREAGDLASYLREHHGDEYERDADEVQSRLEHEVRESTAEDLGKIDTLRFEDRKVFEAALVALGQDRFSVAADYARERTQERSYWVRRDRSRRTGWQLVALAAELGLACERHTELLRGATGLEVCAERYAQGGYEVDLAQRRLEQARGRLTLLRLDELPELLAALNHLREVYRRTVDAQALAFQAVCLQHGFLPESGLRQRDLFDQVVRPLVEGGTPVAYFLVDALRFEMGRALFDQLERESSARVALGHRFAELPSVTEVGMNVLAPLAAGGRLRPEIDGKEIRGFRLGEVLVDRPDKRRKAMHERVGGETCPGISLEELLDLDLTGIRRRIARARLIVIHAEGIDKAGEKGVGLQTFEGELQRLRAAWGRLRDAGVQRFVLTADHGFLLQDDTTRRPVQHGRKIDAKRRHVIERAAADHAEEVRVSSTALGYEGDEVQFMFPATTAPFDTGERTKDFLHGGNSLQERIIPVITAEYRSARGGDTTRYRVTAWAEDGVMGLHRIRGTVAPLPNQGLAFGHPSGVELRIRAVDDADVVVELMHATDARLEAGALLAPVAQEFEVLFRLSGPRELRAKIELCGAAGPDEIEAAVLERRFTVDVVGGSSSEGADNAEEGVAATSDWLDDFEDTGVRDVFRHIAKFGAINEADATRMLGGPRKFRRFSQRFDDYAQRVPFAMKIDASSGQKRYVKEGGTAC